MSSTSELMKLAYLRAKTDQELAVVIDNALERGLNFVCARPAESERIFAEAAMLVNAVRSYPARRRLEHKLKSLRTALDGAAGHKVKKRRAATRLAS